MLGYYIVTLIIQIIIINQHLIKIEQSLIHSTPKQLSTKEKASLYYRITLPPILPGFRYHWFLSLKDKKNRRRICQRIPLEQGNNNIKITLPPLLRGKYIGFTLSLTINDIFSFFQIHYRGNTQTIIKVTPSIIEKNINIKSSTSSQEHKEEKKQLSSEDEFLEQREYYPGDDPRRINWKLLAHHGELFIREREIVPNSQNKKIICLLDTTLFLSMKRELALFFMDKITEEFLTLLKKLEQQNFIPLVPPNLSHINEKWLENFRDIETWTTDTQPQSLREFPQEKKYPLFILSTPYPKNRFPDFPTVTISLFELSNPFPKIEWQRILFLRGNLNLKLKWQWYSFIRKIKKENKSLFQEIIEKKHA